MIVHRAGGLVLALVVCACSGGEERASEERDGPVGTGALSDAQLTALVALINGTEITAGRTVEPKLVSPSARAFAGILIADHTRLAEGMPEYDGPRVSPPQAHALRAVLHSHSAMLTTLPGGPAFDATFAATQVVDHAMAIDSLIRWREAARDAALRGALATALPVMESHLAQARALFASLNQGGSPGAPGRPRPAARDTVAPDSVAGDSVDADARSPDPAARDTTERSG